MVNQRRRSPESATHLQPSTQTEAVWWRPHNVRPENNKARITTGRKWKAYDVREAYERAQKRHDPLLSPHGFFHKLAHGNPHHAIEFLERFGPLMLPQGMSARRIYGTHRFDLAHFWPCHLRFKLVTRLWESRNDKTELLSAWKAVAERHAESYGLHEPVPLGEAEGLIPPIAIYPAGIRPPQPAPWGQPAFPWNLSHCSFEVWAERADFKTIRNSALSLVQQELSVHMRGSTVGWEHGWEPTGEKFRPVIQPASLLALIWEFFALDTSARSWRRCPHCQRLFYPKRRDQFYCSPRQQALASKRAYAARRRAEERKLREGRRKSRR